MVAQAGARIAEHARQHRLTAVQVVLHGGEPLLAGAPRLADIAAALRGAIEPTCELDLRHPHQRGAAGRRILRALPALSGSRSASPSMATGRPTTCTGASPMSAAATIRRSGPSTCSAGPLPGVLRRTAVHDRHPQRPARRLPKRSPTLIPRRSTFSSRTRPGIPPRADRVSAGPRTPTGWRRSSAIGRLTAAGHGLASSTRSSRPPAAAPADRVARARSQRTARHRD